MWYIAVEAIDMKDYREPPLRDGRLISRRRFLEGSAGLLLCGALAPSLLASQEGPPRARYWEPAGGSDVKCLLCPHACRIRDGHRGICRARENRGGVLYTLTYGRPCAIHVDPIEKKPFFHVLPGTTSLSLSTVGCNMRCGFCQNWQISQSAPEDAETSYTDPRWFPGTARDAGAASIAYTYGEPVVFIEYLLDIAAAARSAGLLNVVVTNGYYTESALADLCAAADAIKIDLKAFTEDYYRKICGASLAPVLDSLVRIRAAGVWLEIVYLMVPTLNDGADELRAMARWVAAELGPDVPVHLSRFFPQYRLSDLPPTPLSSLETGRTICMDAGLRYVYIGNVGRHPSESTVCPFCGRTIVSRAGYRVDAIAIDHGRCRYCSSPIPGIWEEGSS
jgi:pyruvate formate lyase activating enzyme